MAGFRRRGRRGDLNARARRIDGRLLRGLSERAARSSRGRANENLHLELEDPVQRFLNAVEPGSYVRPHRHPQPGRWELFLVLRGAAVILLFDGDGVVRERLELRGGAFPGVEIEPGALHTVAALDPGTVLFELKPGPYRPASDKEFAPWAPPEGSLEARGFEAWFRRAAPGDRPLPPCGVARGKGG